MYRVWSSDGFKISKNFVFDPALNTRFVEDLKCDIQKPVIEITKHIVKKDCVVVIEDFKIIEETDEIKGNPQLLTKQFYESLRTDKRTTSTPSRMKWP